MANNPAKTSETIVDPTFFIPEGAVELRYDDDDSVVSDVSTPESEANSDLEVIDSDIFIIDDESEGTDYGYLEVPDNFTIISQTIRTAPGGIQVVDIVAEVDDVAGDITYEYRITKV